MDCKYIGICGSCDLGHLSYEDQLQYKLTKEIARFYPLYKGSIDIIKSEPQAFRNRAEFRIWKVFDQQDNFTLHYAMNDKDKRPLPIDSCSIVSDTISTLMPKLLRLLKQQDILNYKLFSCEFLSSTTNDILVSLIYHKRLDYIWQQKIQIIQKELNIKIIGRSRKQKIVLSDDFINETLTIHNQQYDFSYFENGFTQPNQKVNQQMITWVINHSRQNDDLCELYCGGGNFTIPLSRYFTKVLATEISKTSIKSAKINCALNDITNIKFIRMSSEEFVEALNKVREFTRLKTEDVKLDDYNFSTIFVDPPRAGLDDTTRKLSAKFEQIIYISCNPQTLYRDLSVLCETHSIKHFALFDQFSYTSHIECGVILDKLI
jgi:tRNA (uracil-5-)-methyltransferase